MATTAQTCTTKIIKRRKVETITVTAPSSWAPYLINGDASGMHENDKKACDEWVAFLGVGYCMGCEDVGFKWQHDARRFLPLAADCHAYVFKA